MVEGIVVIVIALYFSIIFHEIGHCILPRVAGVKGFNTIYLGFGKEIFKFTVANFTIVISRVLAPFGYFGGDKELKYSKFNIIQRALIHLGGVILNLIISMMTFGIIYNSGHDFFLVGEITSFVPYVIKNIVYSGLWIFRGGTKGIVELINARYELGIYFYLYVMGIINSFIFVFNTIPIPMMIKNNKVLFNDGGQFVYKGLLNKGTISSKR